MQKPYKRDDILQKTPIISRSLLIVATPYTLSASCYIPSPHCENIHQVHSPNIPFLYTVSKLYRFCIHSPHIYTLHTAAHDAGNYVSHTIMTHIHKMRRGACQLKSEGGLVQIQCFAVRECFSCTNPPAPMNHAKC